MINMILKKQFIFYILVSPETLKYRCLVSNLYFLFLSLMFFRSALDFFLKAYEP